MGNNPQDEIIDPELAKAKKSMGNRVDPDEEPTPAPVVEPVAEPVKEEAAVVEPVKDPIAEPASEVEGKNDEPPAKVERPEAFIPMKKYHAEKDEWKKTESLLADANKKIEELTQIANQQDGAKKDDDIEQFMEQTGFDKETVEGFLKLAEKRLSKGQTMTPEEQAAVAKATAIVKDAEITEAFNQEFKNIGEAEIRKAYPDVTPDQIAKAKDYMDKVAHTADGRDKPLDFLVYKHKDEIGKIFAGPDVPQTKKTAEPSRMGSGKQTNLTANDFKEGKTDFSALADMDQSTRSEIIKNFDSVTYSKFISYSKEQSGGVEVMRNGKKVILK